MIGYDTGYERFVYAICKLNKRKYGGGISRALAVLGRLIWPCDIDPRATIGHVRIPHAVGIVIGNSAVIEDGVWIMSGVVVGNRFGKDGLSGNAHICNNSILGANSSILGKIEIGKNSIIGANAVITEDIPPFSTVVGNNKIICIDNHNK